MDVAHCVADHELLYMVSPLKFYYTNLNESHQYASQILYGYGRSIELFMILYRQGKITGTVYTGAIHSLLLSIITASKQHQVLVLVLSMPASRIW